MTAAIAETEASPPLARVDDPIAAAKERLGRVCLNLELGDDFSQSLDLNSDGLDDVVIRDAVICDGYHSAFCGLGGCSGEVFVALPGGGFMRTDLPPNVRVVQGHTRPAVRAGSGQRAKTYLWMGDRFVQESEAGRVQFSARSAYSAAVAAEAAAALSQGENWDTPDETAAAPAEIAAAGGGADIGRWVTLPGGGPNQLRALVRGADGISALALSCRVGEPVLRLAVKPTLNGAQSMPIADASEADVEFDVIGRTTERRTLYYNALADVWRGAEPARGPLVAALAVGNVVTLRQPGATSPLGRFSLTGSSASLARLIEFCGL